jgi:hypothetical protein
MQSVSELYHRDYHAWLDRHAQLLREGRFGEVDQQHLVEELESMGRRERNEIVSRLNILIAHLLKWQYQPERRTHSWRGSIVEQRVQVRRELRLSPSLKPFLASAIVEAYPDAVHIAVQETELNEPIFPKECPYTDQMLLDEEHWPVR